MNIETAPSVEEWQEANHTPGQLRVYELLLYTFQHSGEHIEDTGWNRFDRPRYH